MHNATLGQKLLVSFKLGLQTTACWNDCTHYLSKQTAEGKCELASCAEFIRHPCSKTQKLFTVPNIDAFMQAE